MHKSEPRIVRANSDQAHLEGSVFASLGGMRWISPHARSHDQKDSFQILQATPDSAAIRVHPTTGPTAIALMLPIWGTQNGLSVSGLKISESSRGAIQLRRDDLDAVINVPNLTLVDLRQAVQAQFGQGPRKQLELLIGQHHGSTASLKDQRERRTTALLSLITRLVDAVARDVGGELRLWRSPGAAARVCAEFQLATDHVAADEVVAQICLAPSDQPLTVVTHPLLQPPAHYPLFDDGDLIDLRVILAGMS